jgi:hypothetical protein
VWVGSMSGRLMGLRCGSAPGRGGRVILARGESGFTCEKSMYHTDTVNIHNSLYKCAHINKYTVDREIFTSKIFRWLNFHVV